MTTLENLSRFKVTISFTTFLKSHFQDMLSFNIQQACLLRGMHHFLSEAASRRPPSSLAPAPAVTEVRATGPSEPSQHKTSLTCCPLLPQTVPGALLTDTMAPTANVAATAPAALGEGSWPLTPARPSSQQPLSQGISDCLGHGHCSNFPNVSKNQEVLKSLSPSQPARAPRRHIPRSIQH